MKTARYVFLVAAVAFPLSISNADEAIEPATPNAHRQCVGSWEVSKPLNRLLGFTDDDSRFEAVCEHPISFRLVLDKKTGEGVDKRKLAVYRDYFRQRRLGHTLVATGKWETKFNDESDPGLGTDCFVTEHRGSTFLWVDTPFVVVYGGKILFLQGLDREHDVLVIDFNTKPGHLEGKSRTPDTVAYKRSPK